MSSTPTDPADPPSSAPPAPQRIHPRAAFASRDFRIFQCARFLAILGWLMQSTAVGYHVYSITGQAIFLGYVGLASFIPAITFSLLTGHVADRYDRRKIVMVCQAVLVLGSIALIVISLRPDPNVWQILSVLLITGTAHAFYAPASQALMPALVPPEHFANAVAWNSSTWQIAAISGPAVGGLVYDQFGSPYAVYALDVLCLGVAFFLMMALRVRTGRMETKETSWGTLLAGLRYIWRRKIVLGAISLDLFAVLLGGATALLPIFAKDILKVGESGFGVLRAAPAIGATIIAVTVAHLPPMRRAGVTMLICVAVFGVATIGFGLSRNYYLSLACLMIMGASDMVSVVIRHTLVQLMTPPEMRGRVSAVNIVFVGASNELGDFESGLVAQFFGAATAVVIGGLGTLTVVLLWTLWFPQLRRFKRLDDIRHDSS